MCRVAVRQAPRQRPEEVKEEYTAGQLYEQLPAFQQPLGQLRLEEDEFDFENLFEDEDQAALETGELDLLALFADDSAASPSATSSDAQQPSVAYGAPALVAQQPLAAGVPAIAGPVMQPAHPAQAHAVHQLQLQAIMQQQQQQQLAAAQQQQAFAAPGMPAQELAQLQQIQAAQMQAVLAAQAQMRQGHVVNKRGKTQAEVEEQQERIKKRRRESAQRSRARKNDYMKKLEMANKALQMENERLRMELMKLTGKPAGTCSSSKPDTPSQHFGSDQAHSELSMSDDEMCDKSIAGMNAGAAFLQTAL